MAAQRTAGARATGAGESADEGMGEGTAALHTVPDSGERAGNEGAPSSVGAHASSSANISGLAHAAGATSVLSVSGFASVSGGVSLGSCSYATNAETDTEGDLHLDARASADVDSASQALGMPGVHSWQGLWRLLRAQGWSANVGLYTLPGTSLENGTRGVDVFHSAAEVLRFLVHGAQPIQPTPTAEEDNLRHVLPRSKATRAAQAANVTGLRRSPRKLKRRVPE